jgi:hypothetical protein
MEHELSLPCSEDPATGPYTEPVESIQRPHILFILTFILVSSSHINLRLAKGLLPSGFEIKILCDFLISPMRAACSAHFILLDLITPNNIW